MTDKTYTIVGVSTDGKVTKFRVANGDMADRIKVLERNKHTDIKFMQLDTAMSKADAIEAFKAKHPEYANVRMPNDKTGTKTVKVSRKTKAIDPATAVLNDAETKTETEAA
jgi:hypothetical protein